MDNQIGEQQPVVKKPSTLSYIIITVLIVVLLSLVGLFLYRQYIQIKPVKIIVPSIKTQTVSPTVVVSPAVTPVNTEEKDLQGIQIDSSTDDINGIEQDINKL